MLFRKRALATTSGMTTFSEGCRQTLAGAREEAARLGHEHVGPDHVLLAIASGRSAEGVGLLEALSLDPALPRSRVLESYRGARIPAAPAERSGDSPELPYTSRAKRLLELAMSAARERGEGQVGIGHLVLGLLREQRSVAAQTLAALGVTEERVADAIRVVGSGAGSRTLALRIDDSSDRSIFEQLVAQVQEAVATGTVQPGDRLPAVRRLADDLDVAPGTVARAYAELERRGVVVTEGARGTRVAARERPAVPDADRPAMLVGLLRPTVVAAYHLGAAPRELREALRAAMRDIYREEDGGPAPRGE